MTNKKEMIDYSTIQKMVRRMTHEIIEKNDDLNEVVLIGVLKKGLPLAQMIQENIKLYTGIELSVLPLDISMHRDDVKKQASIVVQFDVTNKVCIMVDDVLYTGRTVRAALDALVDLGRPKKVQLAVLIDRGHRELPIRADYVGKNIPTSNDELVIVDITSEHRGVFIERIGE